MPVPKQLRKHSLLASLLLISSIGLHAQQVGINNSSPDPSAVLDIQSSNKGLLIPRMTKTERAAIANAANGLMVYQSGPDSIGFYYFQSGWHYINYDSMLPPTAIVFSQTYPNTRLENNNFKYNGEISIPNATVSSVAANASNIWVPIDTTVANYPVNGTADLYSTWADSVFILVGGNSGNNTGIYFHKYNPNTNAWKMVNNTVPVGTGTAQVRVGNKWVFWGGLYNPVGAINNNALAAYIFDAGTYSITQSSLPNDSARRFLTATAIGNSIYFWGGMGMPTSSYAYSTGYRYDIVANTWAPMNSSGAPSARYFAGSIAAGTDLVIWGGYSSGGGILKTGGIYRTATNTWVTMSATNAPVSGTLEPAMAYYNNNVYIISGNETKRFDPVANTWTTLTPPPYSFTGQKFSYDGNGKIYVWGGARYYYPGAPSNQGFVYDIAGDSYTALPSSGAPSARAGQTICFGNGKLLVWGGSASSGTPPTDAESLRSGAVFFLNAENVYITQPLGKLYMYEKK